MSFFLLARCEFLIDGRATGSVLQGVVLEAAIRWHGFVPALLTDDIPYEDTLHLYLLADQLKIADSAWTGARIEG